LYHKLGTFGASEIEFGFTGGLGAQVSQAQQDVVELVRVVGPAFLRRALEA
jgi:hypothetical protein